MPSASVPTSPIAISRPWCATPFPIWKTCGTALRAGRCAAWGRSAGNVANGSPIGDTPPVLIALGATVELRCGSERRSLPLEEFFIDYGKQDRQAGRVRGSDHHSACQRKGRSMRPTRFPSGATRTFPQSARRSTLRSCGRRHHRVPASHLAAWPQRRNERPMRKPRSSASLGHEASFLGSCKRSRSGFQPLSDWRATAEYRLQVSRNLFRRFWLEKGAGAETVRLARAS